MQIKAKKILGRLVHHLLSKSLQNFS